MCAASVAATHQQPRKHGKSRGKGRSFATARDSAAAYALALPSLGGVQSEMSCIDDHSKWAQLALLWLDAGYLPPTTQWDEPYKLVERAASTWFETYCGATRHVGFSHGVACRSEDILPCGSLYVNDGYEDDGHWFFYTIARCKSWRVVRPRLEAIETACPGLGQAVLYGLDEAGWKANVPVLTTNSLRHYAEHFLWYGTSTEEDWKEEMLSLDVDEEYLDEALSPKRFDDSFPSWVRQPGKSLFSSRRLQSIAAGNGDVAEVARCLLGIAKLVGRKNVAGSLNNTELEAIASSAVLCWDHDDMTDRIVDDIDRAINECESGTDLTGIERVAIDGVSFRKWLKKRTETLCLIKQIDQLIELVSVPIKED